MQNDTTIVYNVFGRNSRKCGPMKTIHKIVFTGGPCSGKTTFMSRAEEVFAERGYRVIVDHESATDLISGGISPATMGMYEFQKYVIALQLKKEELCMKAAQNIEGDKVLIFIDRALYDDKSYVSDEEFSTLMSEFGIQENEINDRYDLVMHMVTSAKGEEEAYTYANNSARYETVEDARRVDDVTLKVWDQHPNRIIIGNEKDFEVKMRKAIQAVFTYLEEKPIEIFKKYLIEVDDTMLEKIKEAPNYVYSHLIQYFLASVSGKERRIRKRERGDSTIFTYSEATYSSPNTRNKHDRIISEREFYQYLSEKDENGEIDKQRHAFIYDNHFFKLDIFSFDQSKGLLSVQIPDEQDEIRLPDFIRILKDVSEDKNYKNYYLAKSNKF